MRKFIFALIVIYVSLLSSSSSYSNTLLLRHLTFTLIPFTNIESFVVLAMGGVIVVVVVVVEVVVVVCIRLDDDDDDDVVCSCLMGRSCEQVLK